MSAAENWILKLITDELNPSLLLGEGGFDFSLSVAQLYFISYTKISEIRRFCLMDRKTRVLVAGGDLRQVFLGDFLSEHFWVKKYALDEKYLSPELLRGFDILILPMIVTIDGENLNAPFSREVIPLSKLCYSLKDGGIVFGGSFTEHARDIFVSRGFEVYQYMTRDELVIKNCIPTAEGTLQIAMEELPVTIRELKTLVVGYGRVGKITADLFNSVGASVTATARKQRDLALCKALGIDAKKTSEALCSPEGYDLIINTVPAMVITKKVLEKVNKDCLIIDLASRPGGVDFEAAKELGIKVVWALSLPLKATLQNYFL